MDAKSFFEVFPVSDPVGYAVEAANDFGWLGIGAALGAHFNTGRYVADNCVTTNAVLMSAACERLIASTNAVSVQLMIAGVALFGMGFVAKARRGDD